MVLKMCVLNLGIHRYHKDNFSISLLYTYTNNSVRMFIYIDNNFFSEHQMCTIEIVYAQFKENHRAVKYLSLFAID